MRFVCIDSCRILCDYFKTCRNHLFFPCISRMTTKIIQLGTVKASSMCTFFFFLVRCTF